jgi:hypothetical protein
VRINSRQLSWKDNRLYRQGSHQPLLGVVPDQTYPGIMWRVLLPDGRLSGMLNKARAKDAGIGIALRLLEASETPRGPAVARSDEEAA